MANISELLKSSLSFGLTIKVSNDPSLFQSFKNAFFKRISGSRASAPPPYNPSKTPKYLGGFIVGKEDFLNIVKGGNCEGVHISLGYRTELINGINQHQTHLIFQKIVDNGGQYLDLDTNIVFTTDPDGGNSPDPVFHCPGPNCNP